MNIYVYEDETGEFKYQDSGAPKYIIRDIPSDCDFTLTPPPDYNHVWRWIDTEWVDVPKTDEDRASEDWRQLKAERSSKISSGVLVESTEKVFQTDVNSLAQYASIAGMIALDNYEPVQWKTLDNSFVLLTVDIFKELQRTINENTQSAFRVAEQKRIADQPS